jgi:hypothetical protein
MKFRHLAAPILAFVALAIPAPVAADCEPASSVKEALAATQVAFVGTVVFKPDGPGAALEVEEVWVGEFAATVEIHGLGFNAEGQLGEDDRNWQLGARYLVIPYVGDDGLLRDHICTATTKWRAALADLRPPDAQAPEPVATPIAAEVVPPLTSAPPTIPLLPIAAATLALLILIGAAMLAFRGTGGRTREV